MKGKPNSVIRIPASLKSNFFKYWFKFLKPYHNLTDREIDVIASFVRYRYDLSKVISDPEILDRETMGEVTKRKIREECNLSPQHFQSIMSKLKKSKVVENNKINPRFIPNIIDGENNFTLLLSFELKDEL